MASGRFLRLRTAASAIAVFLVLLAASAAAVMYAGIYSVAATEQHLAPTFRLLDVGLRRSVERHARNIDEPLLERDADLERGRACFIAHCEQCHGGPGVGRADFAKGLLPVPSSLAQASADWRPRELYWITSQGIKMTGMPAWEYRLDEHALWSLVAFLRQLPLLTPEQYQRERVRAPQACERAEASRQAFLAADAKRGAVAIQQYACTACHRIPGIVGPQSHTGPALTAMGRRRYIAGVLPNTPENMVRWLQAPQAVNPHTAMPDLGLTEANSRDIAAYLAQLR
ncbi:MAG: c-type cytochrome [Burkholderiales bacterium]|nr:c-type cytochrome [Burkholderiales bacterium]